MSMAVALQRALVFQGLHSLLLSPAFHELYPHELYPQPNHSAADARGNKAKHGQEQEQGRSCLWLSVDSHFWSSLPPPSPPPTRSPPATPPPLPLTSRNTSWEGLQSGCTLPHESEGGWVAGVGGGWREERGWRERLLCTGLEEWVRLDKFTVVAQGFFFRVVGGAVG